MPEAGSVNFTPDAARRISETVHKVESMGHPGKNLQRRRAGGLGRMTLWEVVSVQTGPETCTIRRVQNAAGDLNTESEKTGILYDTDNEPDTGDRGLLVRLGLGVLFFFAGGAGAASLVAPIKITSGGPGDTYVGNVYENGADVTATETGVTIKVLQIASGETVPANTWFLASKQWYSSMSVQYWTVDVARDY